MVIENIGAPGSYRYLTKALAGYFTINNSPSARPSQLWKELPADYSTTPGGLIGDVDRNGSYNLVDALNILRCAMHVIDSF